MMDFTQRIYLPEAMDALVCNGRKLDRTYRHLAIINRGLSRMNSLLRRTIVEHARAMGTPASVLEVGCGGGDVLAQLARMSRRAKVNLQLVGIDRDPRAIAYAQQRFADEPNLRFSVSSLEHVGGTFDYVFCNHVLHHVEPDNLAPFLRRLSQLKRRRLLINDLDRSPMAYALFTVVAGLLFHRSFAFSDGRLSIRKGFRATELHEACQEARLGDTYRVERLFPWRLVITSEAQR
jgi:2-polyprenyl-3-methyl-5-hydroxy-6-metoxy-1,4-benzoquinol methylase